MVKSNTTVCSIWDKGYRYCFNGKETDSETGLQDYGFRIYNPSLGKFLSVDPLTKSYPHYSPYQFAGNKPIWAIDLDGLEEAIIVSGHPGKMKGKSHFLVNGLYDARQQLKNKNVTKVTWLVYQHDNSDDKKDGNTYTDAQMITYKAEAKKYGIEMIVVNSANQIIDYVNTGKVDGSGVRKTKENELLVEHFGDVGHAGPDGLYVGYQESYYDDEVETDEFDSDAFSKTSTGNLDKACRTAEPDFWTDSQAKDLSERTGGAVSGTTSRTYFSGGIVSVIQLLEDYYNLIGKAKGEEKGVVKTWEGTGGTGE